MQCAAMQDGAQCARASFFDLHRAVLWLLVLTGETL